MGLPNKQIGWSTESNLLWEVLKQVITLQKNIGSSSGGVSSVNGKTGTVDLTSSDIPSIGTTYVPYTGATSNVDLGIHRFIAERVSTTSYFYDNIAGSITVAGNYADNLVAAMFTLVDIGQDIDPYTYIIGGCVPSGPDTAGIPFYVEVESNTQFRINFLTPFTGVAQYYWSINIQS